MTHILIRANNRNVFIQLSPEDWELTSQSWTIGKDGYVVARWKKRYVKLHRLIVERMRGGIIPVDLVVDHIDGNRLNCQRNNLRLATHQQNTCNQGPHKDNKTGYKGVMTNGFSWYAVIQCNGKKMHFGPCKTPLEAARIYNEKAKEYFGEFARLNDI